MINFDRKAELLIVNGEGVGISIRENRIAFRVFKSDKPDTNSLAVSVYNLAQNSRSLLENTKNRVSLLCSYADEELKEVAVGDIAKGITEYLHPNTVTSIEAGDGLVTLRETRVQLSYVSSVGVRQVIQDIARSMGVQLRPTNANFSGQYRQGWAFTGNAKDALKQVTDRFGLEWSIQSNELQIVNSKQPATDQVYLISPQTGLLGSPQKRDEVIGVQSGNKEPAGVDVTLLLNPAIEPASIVAISCRDYDNIPYLVKTVEHQGDTRGAEWYTKLELVEL